MSGAGRMGLALVASLLACGAATAQPAPVAWELVGQPDRYGLDVLLVASGPRADGSTDTLYVVGDEGVWRRSPDGGFDRLLNGSCTHAIRTANGYFLISERSGPCSYGKRSTDRGQTWQRDILPRDAGTALFQSTLPALGGAVYAAAYDVWSSTDAGALGSWTKRGEVPGEACLFGEAPVSAALPQGRLLIGVKFGGLMRSDDGGDTFQPTDGFWLGGLWPVALALDRDAAHSYGGTLYVAGRDFGEGDRPMVYASDDGGASWALRHLFERTAFGFTRLAQAVVAVGPDGALYAGLREAASGPAAAVGTVARSVDGGRTWTQAAEGYGGWAVNMLVVGRDGRLYAATDKGVWRTTAPLAVAGEAPPEAAARVGVSVRPNPANGHVSVVLRVAEAGTARVVVADARGREVAVLLDGAVSAGERTLPVEAAAWPAGVYVVRASVGRQTATARLVVAR